MIRRRATLALPLALAALAGAGACHDRSISMALDSGLEYEDVTVGSGFTAEHGSFVTVHYTVALPDGEVIIDTRKNGPRGRAHRFTVGDKTVIPGLDRGVIGMKPGGTRRLTVPPSSHYGVKGYAGVIPAETDLTFVVELVSVRTSPPSTAAANGLDPRDR